MQLKHQLVCCFILIFANQNYSQNNGQFIEQSLDLKNSFTLTQYLTKDGLPQSQLLDIVPRENGNLIIATANGIVEYNGSEFRPFIKNDPYKNRIYSRLFWNEKWNVLYGKEVNGRPYLLYPEYLPLGEFVSFIIEGDSIYCIDPLGNVYRSHVKKPQFKKVVSTTIKDAGGFFYDTGKFLIGNPTGIYLFDIAKRKLQKISDDRCHLFKRNPYSNDVYGLGNKKVIIIKDTCIKVVFNLNKYNPDAFCQNLTFTDKNDFFVTTTRGLYEANENSADFYSKESALPSVHLIAIYYNAIENCLFVGTFEKGLLKLQIKNCYAFSAAQGFEESVSLSSVIKTEKKNILIASLKGDVYRIGIDTVYPYLKVNSAIASLAEINGVLCVGTWRKGLFLFREKKRIDSLYYPKHFSDWDIHACYKDSRGTIWVGTGNGISKGTTFENIRPHLRGKIQDRIIVFHELRNGNICIGGSDGFHILDKNHNRIVHFNKENGILGREVRGFYEDNEGKLWIATYGGGVYCYYKNKLTSINQLKNSKITADVFCLAKDDLGFLYMSSNYGLWRIKEKDLSDFYYGKLPYLIPFHYSQESGILNTEFNGGFQNNFLKTRAQHFYFPALQGYCMMRPEQLPFRKLNPAINGFFVNDTIHAMKDSVLDRNTFSVEFRYTCTSFLSKYNVYYQYKLQGEKEIGWSTLEKKALVNFKLIPPGSYTFSVRAIDAFNDNKPNVASYRFSIKPYFYETLWFKAGAFLLFVLLIILVARFRVYNYRQKAEEKERIKRQMAELELHAIQSQMNPHFIFNSLNSIKYYLSINDQANADMYIDHFSKLLRDFLESGSKSFINLGKEVQIITSYLELEKQRMNPSFDFFIEAPNQLQLLLIPTHLIQPFVENAIKHGINHSPKKCYLNLRFSKEDDTIICVIEDNGIGREKANEINKNRPYHVSKGVEIVLEKIRIVKEIYNIQIKLTIEDKVDEFSQPIGTYVTLIIPIKKDENTNN